MPCAVTLSFDQETDAAIRGIWQAIEDAGLPSTMLNSWICSSPHFIRLQSIKLRTA